MIGSLTGTLAAKHPPRLLLEVGGVGYELEAPMSTFYSLPAVGDTVRLHTHLVVREDAHQLFGFASESERSLFRSLLKVTGVGAKVALAILSGISVEGFSRCVLDNDVGALTRVPGIGKKTAERLVVEMRDRVGSGAAVAAGETQSPRDEASSALVALGYKPAEAARMLDAVKTEHATSEALIREALRAVARR